MPVFYNPLGTRVVQWGAVLLAPGAVFVFGFNGVVHLDWPAGAPSQAYFDFSPDGGITWFVLITFPIAGAAENSIMVANGITRIRRQAAGVGLWQMRWGGYQFV